MRRTLIAILVIAFATVTAPPATAQPVATGRIIVVWLDGTALRDWTQESTPNLRSLLEEAAIAMVSTRTARERLDARAMRASAAVTVSAGARAAGEPATGRPLRVAGVSPGTFGALLDAQGIGVAVIGDADSARVADRAVAGAVAGAGAEVLPQSVRDRDAPGGRAAPIELLAKRAGSSRDDLVIVDPGDTARVQAALGSDPEAAAGPMRGAMRAADELVGRLRAGLGDRDTLIVLGATPPVEGQRLGLRLAPIAIAGPGFPAGLLSSGTTKREGVVALFDLPATILSVTGAFGPVGDGRAMTVHARPDALARLVALEGDITHSALARFPFTRRALIVTMVLIGLGIAAVLARRGHARSDARVPGTARDVLVTMLLAAAALPLAIYVEGGFPTSGILSGQFAVLAFALGLGFLARAVAGVRGGIGLIAALTALVVVVDVAVGTPLGHRSALGFQIAIGGRFFGVDEGVLGVVVGAGLIGAAMLLDGRSRPASRVAVAAAMAATVVVLGAPQFGSKFGAAATAVPAFGVFALRSSGRRIGWREAGVLLLATAAIIAFFVVSDRVRAPEAQTHVARALDGASDLGAIITRKLEQTWRITTSTIWSVATLVFAGAIGVLAWRARDALARALFGMPHLRAALWASGVGAIAGIVANDGGVIAAAPLLLYGAIATTAIMVGGT